MGEAKRRKKLLGKDYGKKPPCLVEGSPLFERHLPKFSDAWTEKLEAMVEPDELEESEQKFKEEEFNQWMREYLELKFFSKKPPQSLAKCRISGILKYAFPGYTVSSPLWA